MKIKNINNEVINEYPKINGFDKKKLKKYIPSKWSKLGLTTLIFNIIMKVPKVNARIDVNRIDGGFPHEEIVEIEKNPIYGVLDKGNVIFKTVSFLLLILSILFTIIKLYKNKKGQSTKLTNTKMKILYIITAIIVILSIIISTICTK